MKQIFDNIYQFKITLKNLEPPIWRRIQVPETYTFWDLHVAIQDVFGWSDYHLHEFEIFHPTSKRKVRIGFPDDDFRRDILINWREKISDYFTLDNNKSIYTYDFGDNWVHSVILEKILPSEENICYPRCITGMRACPPEDCGGNQGYKELLKAVEDPTHEQHKEMMEWIGKDFDPEHFEINDITFDDPEKRRKLAFN